VAVKPSDIARVAFVITGLDVGGAEKCLTQLALHLDRRQFAPEVYSLQARPTVARASLVDQLEAGGIPIHFLDATSAWSAPRAIAQLRGHFRRQRPHVVQSFLYHANVVAILAARLAAIPQVFTGLRVADPNPYRRQVERWLYRFAALNACVSSSVAEVYVRSGFALLQNASEIGHDQLWQRRLLVIPNAIDVAAYDDAQPADLSFCGCGAERRVILFVGRLDRQKGLDWLLTCLPDLLAQLPNFELVLAGDGPQRDALMRQAVQLAVADRVHFLGWRQDIPQVLKRADLLVLPSRYEGMPNVLLEALAAGVPIVATRAEGTQEVLGDLAESCLVDFGRSHDLITKVVQAATDSTLRGTLVAAGKERMRRDFSIEKMVQNYQQLWRLATSSAGA
jgi:glycosyltransferase involved in cell wall biosynthesis